MTRKKKLNLDLEIRKLSKAIVKGSYGGECEVGRGRCRCGRHSQMQ